MPAAVEHPASALTASGIHLAEVSALPALAIAEIAGRDSVAAAVVAVSQRGFRTILPTAVHTGTEHGDRDAPARATQRLREILGDTARVLPLVSMASPRMWSALNGRYASVVHEAFGVCSPCLACHLYMHLSRVRLAWALHDAPVIAGERDSHGGRAKLSQTPLGIDACTRVLARAGVELLEPVRHVHESAGITALVGDGWGAGERQLRCVHSGNYLALDGSVAYDELAYARYLHGFLEPVGLAILSAWRTESEPDYEAVVRCVLEGSDAA